MMIKLMVIMLKMNFIRCLRTMGIPYKCKANKVRIIFSSFFIVITTIVLLYIHINEPIWAKENLLLAMKTNLHLIFLFMLLIGMVVSINWIRFEEHNEVKFMLSLPLHPNQVYTYKTFSLLSGCLVLASFVLSPFIMDLVSFIHISIIILVIVSGLMLGIGFGAEILQKTDCDLKKFYLILVIITTLFLIVLKETRYNFWYQNTKVILLVSSIIIWYSTRLIIKNFVGLCTIANSKKDKKKNVNARTRCNCKANNEIAAFISKDFTSFFRNKQDLLKTFVMIGAIIVIANLNGFNLDIPFAYIFPYILCNIWIVDLAGQETYYYQINKLIYSGSVVNYYVKRLLSSTLIVLPVCIINGLVFALILKNPDIHQNVCYTFCISVLEIFLATGISIFFKRTSPSSYSSSLGVNMCGQVIYYILGIIYVFLFDSVFSGKILVTLLLGIAIICNIIINILCVIVKE